MKYGTPEQKLILQKAIENGGKEYIADVTAIIKSTNALTYTTKIAQQEVDSAIACLKDMPNSKSLEALKTLALFAIERNY
jgi:octaprenyl-diphosphate synthase